MNLPIESNESRIEQYDEIYDYHDEVDNLVANAPFKSIRRSTELSLETCNENLHPETSSCGIRLKSPIRGISTNKEENSAFCHNCLKKEKNEMFYRKILPKEEKRNKINKMRLSFQSRSINLLRLKLMRARATINKLKLYTKKSINEWIEMNPEYIDSFPDILQNARSQ